jgi:beta-lactamase regulating signal transducer with metallopeptidase domain
MDSLNQFLLAWFVENSVVALLLTGVVLLVCRAGRPAPAMRHALWFVVLLKLMMPPVFRLSVPVPQFDYAVESARSTPDSATAQAGEPGPGPGAVRTGEPASSLSRQQQDEATAVAKGGTLLSAERVFRALQDSLPRILDCAGWIWLVGTAFLLLIRIGRMVAIRRLVSTSRPASLSLASDVATIAARLGAPVPAIRAVPRIASPCIWTLGRSHLLWPEGLEERLSPASQLGVIAHELAHLRRRDHWMGWLVLCAECIWWWNPLFWLIRRQLRMNAELACDAWVVALLPKERRAYAEALINVSEHVSQLAVPAPALGMRSGARQVLERRLTMIMRGRVPCRVGVYGFAGVALLALLALPGWSRVQERKADTTKDETSTKADVLATKPIDLDFVVDISDFDTVILTDDQNSAQSTGDRDRKLHAVEEKLQKLLDEVRSLRGEGDESERKSGQTQTFTIKPKVQSGTIQAEPLRAKAFNVQPLQKYSVDLAPTVARTDALWVMNQSAGSTQADILHRTKYKLPHEKAEALVKFLRDQVKGQTVETKVEGDYVTVTASPEAQRTIGQIVSLIDQKHVTIKLSTTPVEVLTEVTTRKAESKTKPKKAETRERDEEEEPRP